jgi:succinate-acetate transporter protein
MTGEHGFGGYTRIGDPGAAALMIFGMALLWVGITEVFVEEAIGALIYGLLIGAVIQSTASILAFIRGANYLGTLLATFGIWLLGFHLLVRNPDLGTPEARGWYALVLEVPIVLLAVPAIRERAIAIMLAFLFLFFVALFLGLNFLEEENWMAKALGWSAFLASLPIFFLAFERLMKAVEPAHAPRAAEFTDVEERGHAAAAAAPRPVPGAASRAH